MPMGIDRFELSRINDGLASAVSRLYDTQEGCPHRPGTVLAFTSNVDQGGQGPEKPIARATVTAVERSTVGARKGDDRAAALEGCTDAREWYVHLRSRYGEQTDNTPVWAIRFRVEERYNLIK